LDCRTVIHIFAQSIEIFNPYDMKLINLGAADSILNKFIAEMRDMNIQTDSMRFRRNLERVGEIFAYEISKTLSYSGKDVETPLGIARCSTPDDDIVIGTILRAGLPLHNGILNLFDNAQNAFVAAYRKYDKEGNFEIRTEYASTPSLEGKILILADTMLATGSSLQIVFERLCADFGKPRHTHFVCPISSQYAVEHIKKHFRGEPVTLWVAAIDEELTSHSYIVPGLGDAGDLAFGSKL